MCDVSAKGMKNNFFSGKDANPMRDALAKVTCARIICFNYLGYREIEVKA